MKALRALLDLAQFLGMILGERRWWRAEPGDRRFARYTLSYRASTLSGARAHQVNGQLVDQFQRSAADLDASTARAAATLDIAQAVARLAGRAQGPGAAARRGAADRRIPAGFERAATCHATRSARATVSRSGPMRVPGRTCSAASAPQHRGVARHLCEGSGEAISPRCGPRSRPRRGATTSSPARPRRTGHRAQFARHPGRQSRKSAGFRVQAGLVSSLDVEQSCAQRA